MSLKLIIEKTIPNTVIHWINEKEIWVSSGYSLYLSQDEGASFNKVIDLPVPLLTRALSKNRLVSRALRLGVRTLTQLKSGTILAAANRKLYRLAKGYITETYTFNKGIGPLREGWCQDDNGNCYMAEYFLNNKRRVASELLKSDDDGQSWNVIRRLNDIRHIHCVQYDPFSRNLYMGSGDRDNESRISFSRDSGKTWTDLGSGDQLFRAVSLLFTEDYIYWGGDAPTRQNYIVRYNRRNKEIEKLTAVKGTVFYSTILENGVMLFGTTDEGNSEGKNPTADRKSHIWTSHDGTHWEDIISWEKDYWPYILGSGKVLFAQGKSGNKVFFTTEALKGVDGVFTRASIVTVK